MAEHLYEGSNLPELSIPGLKIVLALALEELERSKAPLDPFVITPEDIRAANLVRFRAGQRGESIIWVLDNLLPLGPGGSWMSRVRPQQPAD